MTANHQPEPFAVVRSEAEPGRAGLRLIGELDSHTMPLLEGELSRTREPSPPSVIDLSELRFLDLAGLRALLRAVDDAAGSTRLVGATGTVRRLLDLAHTVDLDAAAGARSRPPFPAELPTRIQTRDDGAPTALGRTPATGDGKTISAFQRERDRPR
jgi:anti-anti-sigma factor